MKNITLIIPCYNEEHTLPDLISELSSLIGIHKSYTFHILFVDDGSTDATQSILKEYIKSLPITIVSLSRNFGHQAALQAGLDSAEESIIVLLDADLQDPPEVISDMIKKYEQGAKHVIAKRSQRNEKLIKKIPAHIFYYWAQKFSEFPFPREVADFRLLSPEVHTAYKSLPERKFFLRGIFAYLGFTPEIVTYTREKRQKGTSKYSWEKMIRLFLDSIPTLSSEPLRILFPLSKIVAATILTIVLLILLLWFSQGLSTNNLLLICFLLIGLSATYIIGTLSIIALYLHAIFQQSQNRPPYIIDSIINAEQ
ncbi:glycosyltransferase family 2 protein [Candidatus Dojkabacteria bacterium]|uniref:Glycosyltransferase family 2 protein n=1 Tax=Candidatus Dojkabacteria bacterium TaxID=2099670 RepID=A0A955L802_9BACT|nr:glycosyltransferase family 2 protein [Candidatus Dojkabacteria bacterium]